MNGASEASDTGNALAGFDSSSFQQCPYPHYDMLRKDEPVARLPGTSTFVISRYQDVVEVLGNTLAVSSQRPWTADICSEANAILQRGWPSHALLVGEDPPHHTKHRKLSIPAFSRRRLMSLLPQIESIAHQLVDQFIELGSADFIKQYAEPLPLRVLAAMADIPESEAVVFRDWAHDMLAMIAGGLTKERQIECAQSTVAFQNYIKSKIDRRKARPSETVISDLIDARDEDGKFLSEGEVINLLCVFLRAGFETTVHLLGNILKQLLQHPNQLSAVLRDSSSDTQVVEETLRTEPPVQRVFRYCVEEAHVGGVKIPAGAKLLVLLGAANRDEEKFERADEFRVPRNDGRGHLAFGFGKHFCIGSQIAREEARMTLSILRARLPGIRLAKAFGGFHYKENSITRGLVHLPIEFEKNARRTIAD
jgi:cytochrome P450